MATFVIFWRTRNQLADVSLRRRLVAIAPSATAKTDGTSGQQNPALRRLEKLPRPPLHSTLQNFLPRKCPERWLSGRKRWIANPVYLERGITGSNPVLSASNRPLQIVASQPFAKGGFVLRGAAFSALQSSCRIPYTHVSEFGTARQR